jgi:hypothetical protein
MPFWLLKTLSLFATGLQKLLRPKHPALDLYAAFAAERYDTNVSQQVIAAAGRSPAPAGASQDQEPPVMRKAQGA